MAWIYCIVNSFHGYHYFNKQNNLIPDKPYKTHIRQKRRKKKAPQWLNTITQYLDTSNNMRKKIVPKTIQHSKWNIVDESWVKETFHVVERSEKKDKVAN